MKIKKLYAVVDEKMHVYYVSTNPRRVCFDAQGRGSYAKVVELSVVRELDAFERTKFFKAYTRSEKRRKIIL